MSREKIKFALRMSPETQQLVKEMCPRDNCQTQNEFIEKAIRFYAGYVSGQEATSYLPPALASVLRATLKFPSALLAEMNLHSGDNIRVAYLTKDGTTNSFKEFLLVSEGTPS